MGIVRRLRRPVDAFSWLEDTALDVKHTVRMFVHTPSFTVAAIAALALGIAVNTAMFSVINAVLLRPFSYHQSDRIVMFQNTFGQGIRTGSAAPVEFNWWRQQTDAFENVSAYAFNVANLGGESFTELIPTLQVSAHFFRLCFSNAVHGRTFTAQDDSPSAPKTVVLAHSFWQRQFGGDTGVIGRRITLNSSSREIIGVAHGGPHYAPAGSIRWTHFDTNSRMEAATLAAGTRRMAVSFSLVTV